MVNTVANIVGQNSSVGTAIVQQAQATTRLWIPEEFASPVGEIDPNHWKNLSHYPIENIFDDINFGSNPHKIHFATPGEGLHMHQL